MISPPTQRNNVTQQQSNEIQLNLKSCKGILINLQRQNYRRILKNVEKFIFSVRNETFENEKN